MGTVQNKVSHCLVKICVVLCQEYIRICCHRRWICLGWRGIWGWHHYSNPELWSARYSMDQNHTNTPVQWSIDPQQSPPPPPLPTPEQPAPSSTDPVSVKFTIISMRNDSIYVIWSYVKAEHCALQNIYFHKKVTEKNKPRQFNCQFCHCENFLFRIQSLMGDGRESCSISPSKSIKLRFLSAPGHRDSKIHP